MEARVKALTREVGTLMEELKRERKRRERALQRSNECEAAVAEAEQRIQELQYTNRKLSEDLLASQNSMKLTAQKNNAAVISLTESLGQMKAAAEHCASHSSVHMQAVYSVVQRLHNALFQPANAVGSSSSEAQGLFSELQSHLSKLSGLLGTGTKDLERMPTCTEGAACEERGTPSRAFTSATRQQDIPSAGTVCQKTSDRESNANTGHLQRPRGRPVTTETDHWLMAVLSQLEGLIPQYRQSLAKLKIQATSLKEKLERASDEKSQMGGTVNISQFGMEQELYRSNERCSELKALHTAVSEDYQIQIRDLQARFSQGHCRYMQQCVLASDLQTLLQDQASDIQTLLDVVATIKTGDHYSINENAPPKPCKFSAQMLQQALVHNGRFAFQQPDCVISSRSSSAMADSNPGRRVDCAQRVSNAAKTPPCSSKPGFCAHSVQDAFAGTQKFSSMPDSTKRAESMHPAHSRPDDFCRLLDMRKVQDDMQALDSEIDTLEDCLRNVAAYVSR